MKKKIELEVEFDNGFIPPEKFNDKTCFNCPFYSYDQEETRGTCDIDFTGFKHCCPIKKFFENGNH